MKLLKSLVTKYPVVAVLTVGVLIVLVVFVSQHSSSTPTTTTTPLPPTTSVTTTTTVPPTTTTSRPGQPTLIIPSQATYPAFAHIPYNGNGILVAVMGMTASGQIELEVYSQTLTVPQEKAVYEAFLAQYHDPGTKYIPTFASDLGQVN